MIAAKGGMIASEGGIVTAEGGMVASEGGMIALEGGIVVSEGGIVASEGGLTPFEGDIMHLGGDITSFVGCKATILPNLQAPSAPANPSSRRRFGARGRHFERPGALAPVPPLLDPRLGRNKIVIPICNRKSRKAISLRKAPLSWVI